MINNKGRKGKRYLERAMMYYYSIITSEILSNYKSYISTYILYTYVKPKYNTMSQFLLLGGNRQNYYSQYKDNNF